MVRPGGKRMIRDLSARCDARQFGLVGDGAADDTAALQAAVNAGAGGFVSLPAGIFSVRRVLVPNGTVLLGAGRLATIIVRRGDACALDADDSTGVLVARMAVDLRRDADFRSGVHANRSTGFRMADVRLLSSVQTTREARETLHGLLATDAADIRVENVAVDNAQIKVDGRNVVVQNIAATNATNYAISVVAKDGDGESFDAVLVQDVVVDGFAAGGVYFGSDRNDVSQGSARGLVARRIRVRGEGAIFSRGFTFRPPRVCSDWLIEDCHFEGTADLLTSFGFDLTQASDLLSHAEQIRMHRCSVRKVDLAAVVVGQSFAGLEILDGDFADCRYGVQINSDAPAGIASAEIRGNAVSVRQGGAKYRFMGALPMPGLDCDAAPDEIWWDAA